MVRTVFRRILFTIIPALTALLLLTGCQSLGGGRVQEPPLPTIVPAAESTATPLPVQTEVEKDPTATPSPTSTTEPVGDTVTVQPTETPAEPVLPTETPTEPVPPTAPPPSPEPTLVSAAPVNVVELKLIPVAGGFTKPTFVTHAGDGTGRLFIVEQPGRIFVLKDGQLNPTPFLDIISLVGSDASEQGLLSVAFHPDYANNGLFFVDYTDKQGDTVIARYQVSDNPDVADPNSAKILLTIGQPYRNHNGGQLAFGPDGYLYVGMGDGGSANDPENYAQNLGSLLGKLLRLDVDQGDPYGVPQSNPFINQEGARPEIWSYGWRNPWRFSFDSATGDMYIGDVGQNQYEEIDFEPAGAPGGLNYGWRLMEGSHCFNPSDCDPASLDVILPIAEYDHSQGCSVTGGYVYRGSRFPDLTGLYLYGDYCSGLIWGLRRQADGSWSQAELLQSGLIISSFGQDQAGELYVVDYGGELFQVGQ